ncbi:MAG TPA: Rieske 2Fe-2S domain-containing protein [Candidatus Sericytochromatia bacterium]|jgi:phenylpropionate dioxygenase-like ring-hydroxylating dioxygenase large terminal subunit
MIADTPIKEQAQKTATVPRLEGNPEFNWKHCWYPVTFVQDLPKDRPYSFSLYDEPLVLFKNQDGKLGCLTDYCPHRAARLSDGQIIDGKLECLYHGWQFGTDGQCLNIPQLPADAKIPTKACVKSFPTVERQGIVWVWPGEPEAADIDRIPTVDVLDKPGFVYTDYMVDLPHDQTYLIENVLDPAHVSISHHGSQGNRKNAQPLEIEIIESSAQRIRGRWRGTQNPDEAWKYVDFIAPNLVHNIINLGTRDWCVGLVSYGLPLGKGRCRLLFRGYRNFFTWTEFLKPRWFGHLRWNKILEEDLSIIARQEEQIERLGKSLKEIYLPLKTTDTLLIEYRKWLDKYGSNLPFYEGYSTSKRGSAEASTTQSPVILDRYKQHTGICSSCQPAHQVANRLKQALVAVAIGIAAVAMLIDEPSSEKLVAVAAFLGAAALAFVAHLFKTKFERSYDRS